ncbi:glycoside hydrolase family 3 N-terminal domain-containing protein [uncultured Subdoligranulum sp.]|uniref:glycoside hydrolase family 3 N-terminal domain-containing protein n=1 Tax=uncultured Subdoligranulum sp. TaxID=512298 RepID=UPI0032087C70
MLAINMDDVLNVLNTVAPYLIGFAVVLVLAIIVMIACQKLGKTKKYLIRSQAGLAILLAFGIVANLVAFGPMSTMISLATGGGTISEESTDAATELCTDIAEEGIVLLKNDDSTLPLASGDNVNVFGWASINPCYGGTGSGALSDAFPMVSLLDGLRGAGLNPNQELIDFYTNYKADRPEVGMWAGDWTLPEPAASLYTDELMNSAKEYSDTAIIVITRVGGEGADLPTDMAALAAGTAEDVGYDQVYDDTLNEGNDWDEGDTYLNLTNQEEAMVDLVCKNFDKVVVVYNGANTMELGFVDQYPQIKSVLWCPGAGQSGFSGLGNIIAGAVNPSAKTTDTFVYDLTATPTFNNFGMMHYTNMDEFAVEDTLPSFVNYVEDIYVGYKFYETAATEGLIDYDKTVQYPFGYGLSYTTFSQTLNDVTEADGVITVSATVTNTGSVAGKDVVEVYYNPPYTNGGIEKASANLIGFAKTQTLEPGASEDVTVTFNVEDMASYDDKTAKAYVLEAGDYVISINSDSHTVIDSKTYNVPATITYSGDNKRSGDEVTATNQFDYARGTATYLSRADHFANYAQATAAPASYEMPADSKATFYNISNYDATTDDDPDAEAPVTGAAGDVQLVDLRGLDYDDPAWDGLLDRLTVEEMNSLISLGGYQTNSIDSIGKVRTNDCDGPASINNNFTGTGSIGFPAAVMIANTWNVDIATSFGDSIGQMAEEMDVSGWYAPAMNIHRSAFAGRNFEYYSEDGFLSGQMAAHAVQGAATHGVYAYVKHFAMNDQETNRCGMLCTWSTEQAIREIYLKPFEIAIKQGGAQAVMSSFNYIGNRWAGGTKELCQTVLRDEWGFQGFVLTDYFGVYGYMSADQGVRNGTDCMLVNYPTETSMVGSLTDGNIGNSGLQAMRTATHNILYTVVNSRAYTEENLNPGMPAWQIGAITIDVVLVLIIVGLEVGVVRKGYTKRKEEEAKATVQENTEA